jgi:eukaryotic-like serine/threonine-protein kinase
MSDPSRTDRDPMDPDSPVADPARFVGQSGIVRRIFSRVGADRPQSVAVIGGKKSGKTSLLAYVLDDAVRSRLLEDAGRYVFAAAGAEGSSGSPESFLAGLHRRLEPGKAPGGYEGVRQCIEALHAAGKRIVVLCDDFHAITSSERYPLEFFSFLRSLANNYNLAYVTTSFLELQKLCVVKDVEESPFFNIFTNLSLGMLSAEEARVLAAMASGGDGERAEGLAAWCGGSPYAIKAAARALAASPARTLSDAELSRACLQAVTPYFTQVVSLLPPSAARPLQAIARGRKPSEQEAHLLASLVKQGFLVERGEAWESYSPSFTAFLTGPFSPKMLQGRA